ncbi:hypothetical protein ACFXO9_00390 [Nocardia tengchongensis]
MPADLPVERPVITIAVRFEIHTTWSALATGLGVMLCIDVDSYKRD